MSTPDQLVAEQIARSLEGRILRLKEERRALLRAAARITEIDAEVAILEAEKLRIEGRRPPRYHLAMSSQLAKFAHDLVSAAPIRGADAEAVANVKQWLAQIAQGKLVVGAPVPPKVRKAKPE
jgi:hypothetical protein